MEITITKNNKVIFIKNLNRIRIVVYDSVSFLSHNSTNVNKI